MDSSSRIIANAGLGERSRKSRWPARLDVMQSLSGLILALFMWGHMFFVSSILVSKDAMWTITKMFEGYFFFGRAHPWIVSIVVGCVFALVIGHALLALRKFPINYRQYRTYRDHMAMMHHEDTTLWFWQVFTGFALFFLASVHLYTMLMHADRIGPYESSDRVWTELMWPLYILLLLAVEFHGGIGLYRLTVKWGFFAGGDPVRSRVRLKRLKWAITVFFLVLGFTTLAAYIRIGIEHEGRYGERYVPSWQQPAASPVHGQPSLPVRMREQPERGR